MKNGDAGIYTLTVAAIKPVEHRLGLQIVAPAAVNPANDAVAAADGDETRTHAADCISRWSVTPSQWRI